MYRLRQRLRIAAGVLLALALVGLLGFMWALHWRPSPGAFPIQGIDISSEQGVVDWFGIKAADAEFAYIRATVGADRRDPMFAANWAGAYEAGVRRGAIHVYSLCRLASDQARIFVTTVPREADALPVAVELDFHPDCTARPSRAVVIDELRRFLIAIETHTGKPSLLRISRGFEREYGVAEAIPRPLWSVQPFFPPDYFPRPWRMWQASGFRRIEGVDRPVHWDVVAP